MRVHQSFARLRDERGAALITAMLIMMLMSALMIGFTSVVMSDQQYRYIDRDRVRAFYGAQSGVEKLNSDLSNLFLTNVAPTDAQITALGTTPPTVPSITFASSGTGLAYAATPGGPAVAGTVTAGPYQGLYALERLYTLDATARTAGSGEVHLRRRVQTVAIPVFQFGMFSDVDLSFSAADQFDFGGRVHTNSNLFLAQGGAAGDSLILRDKVTAFREIVRKRLSNGEAITVSGSTRTVSMAKAPNSFRSLADTEGSVVDTVAGAKNPSWPTISLSTYNGYIRNGLTGVKRLDLPLITTGGANVDLIRRPAVNENTTLPNLFGERYFSKVSLRILLSDTANDITTLPTVTATAPVALESWTGVAPYAGYTVTAATPAVAQSIGPLTTTESNASASTTTNIFPTAFATFMPALTLNGTAVTCTAKDAANNRFTGCNVAAAAAVGATLSAGNNINATTTAAVAVGAAVTIPVGAGQTVPFTPLPFWSGNNLVTCTGWTGGNQYTGCTGLTAAPANGSTFTSNALSNAGTGLIGGFIKVEMQNTAGVWSDVTAQFLGYGIGGANLGGTACADPTPNAILRIQRLRDNGGSGCTYGTDTTGARDPRNWWPNTLFDTREGVSRDTAPGASPLLGGVMHYIAIDALNLSRWFQGVGVYAAGGGTGAISDNGYSVYFSDRRNNRDLAGRETGEYGYEDVVNPASATGAPNGVLDAGEDVNGNGTLETYGQFPSYNGATNSAPPGAAAPLNTAARPTTAVTAPQAKVNRAILFRRALKLINGTRGNLVTPGLTIASENPLYVQGNWNADAAGFGDPHVATSVAADTVTMLSNSWNDLNSFSSPYAVAGRPRSSDTYYRMAVISGKGPIFPRPAAGAGATYGTDGGAHSFLRFLEGAGPGNDRINYRGSMVTFFYNRQAVTPFKCCGGIVYAVPTRAYAFDIDFLDPAKLPPLTPVFRDINALGFEQETRPGR